jgi:hypothetical protein
MRKSFYYLLILAAAACTSAKKTTMNATGNASAMDDGWISLFDGKTTNGWHTYGKTSIGRSWKVDDGALHLDAASKKGFQTEEGGDIVTNDEFENFDLKLEWKISPKGNSGVIFYIHEDAAQYQYPWQTGPEMQVLDNGTPTTPGHPDGKLYTHRAGDLYDLLASKEAIKPVGEWNQAEIVANKGKLDFYLNGEHTLSTNMWDDNWRQMVAISKFKDMSGFSTYKKGRIALQDHGNDVWFRNIRIKKL